MDDRKCTLTDGLKQQFKEEAQMRSFPILGTKPYQRGGVGFEKHGKHQTLTFDFTISRFKLYTVKQHAQRRGSQLPNGHYFPHPDPASIVLLQHCQRGVATVDLVGTISSLMSQ